MAEEEIISWFAGVDWGSERHQVCLLDARGTTVGEREFPHSGEGLAELGDWLLSMASAASTVAVAIEVPHGPVVDALIDRGFVVYAINPKQVDRLRDRFSVAGAKDDRRDAYVQADGLRTDRRLFRRLQVADPRLIELRAWSRLAEELRAERVRLSNRVRHQLWRYYPQMQKLTNDLAAPWFLELWAIASTPAKAGRLRKSTVERLLKQHRIRRMDAETVLRPHGTLRWRKTDSNSRSRSSKSSAGCCRREMPNDKLGGATKRRSCRETAISRALPQRPFLSPRDRRFESALLQRRVGELSVPVRQAKLTAERRGDRGVPEEVRRWRTDDRGEVHPRDDDGAVGCNPEVSLLALAFRKDDMLAGEPAGRQPQEQ